MLILAVDTSTPSGSLAVLRDLQVLGMVSASSDEPYSSRLFRDLDFLLRETSAKLEQFDLFAVVAGPGSFTGLRVGLTAVKGWAEVYSKPIAAVSGLEAVASLSRSSAQFLAPVMDARRGQVFGGLYEKTGNGVERRGDEVVMTLDEFIADLASRPGGQQAEWVTTTSEAVLGYLAKSKYHEAAQREARAPATGGEKFSCEFPLESVSSVLAPVVGQVGWRRAQSGKLVDALTLDANYIRRSDAELLWKGL